MQRLGECAHRELAHRIGRHCGRSSIARHAAHQYELSATGAQRRQRFFDGAQQPENVGLELPSIIFDRQFLHGTGHAETRIGINDVDTDTARGELIERSGNITLAGHVALMDADLGSERAQLRGQGLEPFGPAGKQSEAGAAAGVLPSETGTDTGRSAGDEDGLAFGHGDGSSRGSVPRFGRHYRTTR